MERPQEPRTPDRASAREARKVSVLMVVMAAGVWAWTIWSWIRGEWLTLLMPVAATMMFVFGIAQWRRGSIQVTASTNETKRWHRRLFLTVWLLTGIGLIVELYVVEDYTSSLMYWFILSALGAYLEARPRIAARQKRQSEEALSGEHPRPVQDFRQRLITWWLKRERPGFYVALVFGAWLAVILPALLIEDGPSWWLLPFGAGWAIALYGIFRKPPKKDLPNISDQQQFGQ
jgi:hypothetical protein